MALQFLDLTINLFYKRFQRYFYWDRSREMF